MSEFDLLCEFIKKLREETSKQSYSYDLYDRLKYKGNVDLLDSVLKEAERLKSSHIDPIQETESDVGC